MATDVFTAVYSELTCIFTFCVYHFDNVFIKNGSKNTLKQSEKER